MQKDTSFDHESYSDVWPFPTVNQDDMPLPFSIKTGVVASLLMRDYFEAMHILEETGNPEPLNALAGRTVEDALGYRHRLPDANFIASWLMSQSDEFRREWEQQIESKHTYE